jgi:heme/copper-type cytochrome/quinol oxidase subunit 4
MKRALVIALVLTVLLTGVPVMMVMSGATCADCDHALMAAGACLLAVLAALVAVVVALFGTPMRTRPELRASLLAASGLDRPPRLA